MLGDKTGDGRLMERLTLPLCAPGWGPPPFKAVASRESDPTIYRKGHSPDRRRPGCGSGAVSEQAALGHGSARDEGGSGDANVRTPGAVAILGIADFGNPFPGEGTHAPGRCLF